MKYYWVIYGYDENLKDPIHYYKIYASGDMAKEKLKELLKDENYKWVNWCMERVEAEDDLPSL